MVKGKSNPSKPPFKQSFSKSKGENTIITYYNHTHMTAIPTRLLLDTNLSAEAKLTGNGYLKILEENGAFGLHLKG